MYQHCAGSLSDEHLHNTALERLSFEHNLPVVNDP